MNWRAWFLFFFVCSVLSANPVPTDVAEKDVIYSQKTQTIQINIGEEKSEGVLLLKHLKFGRPIYLVATYVKQKVNKTKMVSEKVFYDLYNIFQGTFGQSDLKRTPENYSKCATQVMMSRKIEGKVMEEKHYCVGDSDAGKKNNFTGWYRRIKDEL